MNNSKDVFAKYLLVLENNLEILPDKDEENAHNTLCALWHLACGQRYSPILAEKNELCPIDEEQVQVLERLIQMRLSGTPLSHLTERQNFMGLEYIVPNGVYIPRKETELLVVDSNAILSNECKNQEKCTVLDLCTGIGTVALAIAHYNKNAFVYGADIFVPAIDAAKVNVEKFQLGERTSFFISDMFDCFTNMGLDNSVDVIVSAPPYISSSKIESLPKEIIGHEQREAFDAGPFGLAIFSKLIAISPTYLKPNGYLIVECGAGQGAFLSKRIKSNENYSEVVEISDHKGDIRIIRAKKRCC